jgi:hypothetical protein
LQRAKVTQEDVDSLLFLLVSERVADVALRRDEYLIDRAHAAAGRRLAGSSFIVG